MNWDELIRREKEKDYFKILESKLALAREQSIVYPQEEDVFNAFKLCSFDNCKVVIIGQDPYHQAHQAMGLSFSVNKGIRLPKSLHNIYKELGDDLGIHNMTGDLSNWARQGVFLINNILTVEESKPLSHQGFGWEVFTDTMISELNSHKDFLIFVLWGKEAQKKKTLIDSRHYIIESSHPSPLSSYRGFFGSKPFSEINRVLKENNLEEIDWRTDV